MDKYDYVPKILSFATENGYKVKNLNVGERRNQRGYYDYVELALIIPREPARTLETIVEKIEESVDNISAEAQKDNEV